MLGPGDEAVHKMHTVPTFPEFIVQWRIDNLLRTVGRIEDVMEACGWVGEGGGC